MKKLNLIKNKKGGDRIISVYWFAILFIVAAAMVYLVVSFYGKPYDVRELEANALTNKIADCFSKGGYFVDSALQISDETFLDECGLNFQTENVYDWNVQKQFYVEVSVEGFNSENQLINIASGNLNLKDFCNEEGDNFPLCLKRSFYSVDKENNQYKINILTIVRKTEKNVQ